MESRNYKLDSEWNRIHYPERPNGFGILLIGDERHFVTNNSSFWMQNEGKRAFLNFLKDEGYTVFYSNLYGKHWGSERAVELAKRLCSHIVRTEILNSSFHIIAEGMGALAALKMLEASDRTFRSIVLINPILSLSSHLEQERVNKFFYKKLLSELAKAYETDSKEIQDRFREGEELPFFNQGIPIKIIHVLSGNRAYKQSNLLKRLSVMAEEKKLPVSISYVMAEKKQQISTQAVNFFHKHEQIL